MIEHMFAGVSGTVDRTVEAARIACLRELAEISAQEARNKQRVTRLVREADERGDWRAAGYASLAQWFAQAYRVDSQTAKRVTETSGKLDELPALDAALGSGALSLEQVAAAVEYATPATDAQLASSAVGKAPSVISLAARASNPPTLADDQALYARRSLSLTWTHGRRELCLSGRLPLELGTAFEDAIWELAKRDRAADTKRSGSMLAWSAYAADALVSLAHRHPTAAHSADDRVTRSPTTVIVHLSPDQPPTIEGAGPISHETAERLACDARRLTLKPEGRDLVHSRVTRCASYAQKRALHKRSGHCQYPACDAQRELEAHHLTPVEHDGRTELDNLILLCPRHHTLLHDHRMTTSGTGQHPRFADQNGRTVTAHQPHAPPA